MDNGSRAAVRTSRRIIKELFGPVSRRAFAVRYWDGSEESPTAVPSLTIVLRHPGALRHFLLPPSELAAAEAYLRDEFDVEGDLEQIMLLVDRLGESLRSPIRLIRLALLAARLPETPDHEGSRPTRIGRRLRGARHTRVRDSASVRSHYDVGNAFYGLCLDRRLVYSCAYFPTGDETLDQAQEAKLEYICRKLRLKHGDTLLDIGCGWGGLALYAAERYGAQVTGITLSEEQARLARQRAVAAGLADRVQIEVRDYRDLPAGVQYDRVVSVGMLEHVGRKHMDDYFALAMRATKPGGVFLAHGIVNQDVHGGSRVSEYVTGRLIGTGRFIDQYVFPDGELPEAWELARSASRAGWKLHDVENLREHYMLTLRHWVHRLEARHGDALLEVDERTYRIWRLYMSGAASGFARGSLGVVQLLLSRSLPDGGSPLPRTRTDIYRQGDRGSATPAPLS